MNTTIHKVSFQIADEFQEIELPLSAKVLSIQLQSEIPTIWYLRETEDVETKKVLLRVVGTGWNIEWNDMKDMVFRETLQIHGFVWHIFIKE